jgi:crotonobetainyl-CoA:carnitine CoA-transferase CaiB-like acyl-CoA transferase
VKPGADTDRALGEWGFEAAEVARLKAEGAVA